MSQTKKTAILTTLLCLVPVVMGIILYPQLPENIVTHWDAHGVPNGWSSKFTGAIVFPSILVLVNLFVPALMKTDPKYENMDAKLKLLVQWLVPLIAMVCSGVTLASGIGIDVPVSLIVTMLLGLVFVMVGNLLPKTKQSYTMGIKLPWTLNSEENWNRTHRMAGFLWVVMGFVMIIGGFLPFRGEIVTACILAGVIVPTIYSYLLFRKGI